MNCPACQRPVVMLDGDFVCKGCEQRLFSCKCNRDTQQRQPSTGLRIPGPPPDNSKPIVAGRFVADGVRVRQGHNQTACTAVSGNMAKRIANALNAYTPDGRGQ